MPDTDARMLPSKVHAIVLVSKVHKPTLRALAFARATRPDTLTALTVNVDDAETRGAAGRLGALRHAGAADRRRVAVPGDHPAGASTTSRTSGGSSPRELVVVFVPQYVVGHWWENVLHNQSALRLRARLQFQPGVMITTVPWQLESSLGRDGRRRRPGPAPGDLRRGRHRRRGRRHAVWLTTPRPHARRLAAGPAAGPGLDRAPSSR